MTMKNLHLLASVLLVSTVAAGCGTTPRLDARFGETTTTLRAQQLRDPTAAVRNEGRPVDGIEGTAASHAVDQYYQTFTKPPPPMTIYNFGVAAGI
jgi:hypothetical protein